MRLCVRIIGDMEVCMCIIGNGDVYTSMWIRIIDSMQVCIGNDMCVCANRCICIKSAVCKCASVMNMCVCASIYIRIIASTVCKCVSVINMGTNRFYGRENL